jgi:cytochrome P450
MIEIPASFRPPAPLPRTEAFGPIALLRALRDNPLEAWTREHFENPVVVAKLPFGQVAVVNDPDAVQRVLLENVANYRKDVLQRRIVAGALNNSLLTAETEQWRFQRRALAPMFARKTVQGFAPVMLQVADALVARWRQSSNGKIVDVAAEVTRLTLDVLRQTIFSDGLGRDTEDFREAMRSYFDTIGQIDPFDLLNLPEGAPCAALLRIRGRRDHRPAPPASRRAAGDGSARHPHASARGA